MVTISSDCRSTTSIRNGRNYLIVQESQKRNWKTKIHLNLSMTLLRSMVALIKPLLKWNHLVEEDQVS